MDTNLVSSVQQRTPTKRSKSKKKPIKIVYISNPMKVKTSASEFRALVQELTGQDAELPPDPSRFQDPNSGGGGDSGNHADCDIFVSETGHESNHTVAMPPVEPENCQRQLGSSTEQFEPFDDVFTPEMIENISAFLPASIFYESAQVDEVLRRVDAV